jgi:hypothetical protein
MSSPLMLIVTVTLTSGNYQSTGNPRVAQTIRHQSTGNPRVAQTIRHQSTGNPRVAQMISQEQLIPVPHSPPLLRLPPPLPPLPPLLIWRYSLRFETFKIQLFASVIYAAFQ